MLVFKKENDRAYVNDFKDQNFYIGEDYESSMMNTPETIKRILQLFEMGYTIEKEVL